MSMARRPRLSVAGPRNPVAKQRAMVFENGPLASEAGKVPHLAGVRVEVKDLQGRTWRLSASVVAVGATT